MSIAGIVIGDLGVLFRGVRRLRMGITRTRTRRMIEEHFITITTIIIVYVIMIVMMIVYVMIV